MSLHFGNQSVSTHAWEIYIFCGKGLFSVWCITRHVPQSTYHSVSMIAHVPQWNQRSHQMWAVMWWNLILSRHDGRHCPSINIRIDTDRINFTLTGTIFGPWKTSRNKCLSKRADPCSYGVCFLWFFPKGIKSGSQTKVGRISCQL